jgi:hypothetical protein
MCRTLTAAVSARNQGFVSVSMRLTSSSSALVVDPCCCAACAKLAVIEANTGYESALCCKRRPFPITLELEVAHGLEHDLKGEFWGRSIDLEVLLCGADEFRMAT